MKIIHSADNHLGAPLIGLSLEEARARREELTSTFLRMLSYASESGVEAVLLCGDLFDTPTPSSTLIKEVLAGIAACKAQVFFVTGNHDDGVVFPYLPSNFHLFKGGFCRYQLGDVVLSGADYGVATSELLRGQTFDENALNLLLLHGEVRQSATAQKGVVDLSALAGKPIDYLAMGHIHAPSAFTRFGRGGYRYCGCLEGHGFDECGERGFVLLDTAGGLHQTFIPFATRRYHEVEVDISGVSSMREGAERALSSLAKIPQKDGVKIRLKGSVAPEVVIRTEWLENTFKGQFFAVKGVDESVPCIDFERYRKDRTIKGGLVRLAEGLPKEERAQVLALAFRALAGEDLS